MKSSIITYKELFKLAGTTVEDAYNKMLLPNVEGSKYINTNRSIHYKSVGFNMGKELV